MPRDYAHLGKPQIPHYGIVCAGELGNGKSVLSLSYTPQGWPGDQPVNRLVIDEECRAISYRAQRPPWNLDHDDHNKLLYTFHYFPGYLEKLLPADFVQLYEAVKSGDWSWWPQGRPDVLVFDNWGHFQSAYAAWMNNKELAAKLVYVAGLTDSYRAVLVLKGWAPGDPGWWNMIEQTMAQFFIDLRAAGISWIANSLMKNVWKDYGKRGINPDDNLPYQRIIGRTAVIWPAVLAMADVSWVLDRHEGNTLRTTPRIDADYFHPKCSIPGVPPKFEWVSWDKIWQYERIRLIPGTEAWREIIQTDTVEFDETTMTQIRQAGKIKLAEELCPQYYPNGKAIRAALAEMGYDDYDPRLHDELKEKLIDYATRQPAS